MYDVYQHTPPVNVIMRTNIVIDDELMSEAISLTGIHTKRELVNLALKELVQNRKKGLVQTGRKNRIRGRF